jgi:hypothetical protein
MITSTIGRRCVARDNAINGSESWREIKGFYKELFWLKAAISLLWCSLVMP